MKIQLYVIGKTAESYLSTGIAEYKKRLGKYIKFNLEVLPDIKNAASLSEQEIKLREGEVFLKKINPTDTLVLLDENGKAHTSEQMAEFIQHHMNYGGGDLVFIVGGAYGFSDAMYQRANSKLSLSKMTFSHQMVRLIFIEQLYRAFTIIKGEPYHHK